MSNLEAYVLGVVTVCMWLPIIILWAKHRGWKEGMDCYRDAVMKPTLARLGINMNGDKDA